MANIFGTSGNDPLTGTPDPDTINGLAGDDTIDGAAGDDGLFGEDGNDEIQGGLGNDVLSGGDGDDTLDGGDGIDQLSGGAGNDTMVAQGGDSADGGSGIDALTVRDGLGSIFDGGADSDTLTLDFALAASGITANLNLLWAGNTGTIGSATVSGFEAIAGTVAGSGLADSITIGQNYNASTVTMDLGSGDDTGVGGSLGDTLSGGDGHDSLQGLDGADILTGGLGNDTLTGGNGNDTLNDADGTATLTGDGGDDIVMLGALTGGSADGGTGTDHLRFDLAAAAAGVSISLDFSGSSMSGNLGGVSISGFETLHTFFNQTTEHNDTLTFGAAFDRAVTVRLLGGNDTYSGGSGGDYVEGGSGDDTLGGGAGTNTLIGGIGNDSYVVENGTTSLVELAGQGTDTVLASLTWGLADEFENLTLTGFGDINGYGNGAANVITGNNGANRVEAGGGNDAVNGGGGNDTLYGMEGNDTVNGEGGNDNIEDGVGINTLNGGGGDDYIVFSGDAVNTADGGVGSDSLSISNFNRTSGFVIDLTAMWTGGAGSVNGGTATGFEALIGFEGTQWADVINFGAGTTASAGINDAGAGDDILTGSDGANYMNGGEGNDTIVSGAGTDEILGGAGDDTITIGAGTAGTVDGDIGTDTLGLVPAEPGALDIDLTLLWSGGTGFVNGVAVTGVELLQTNFIQSDHFVIGVADSVVIGAGYTGNLTLRLGRGADSASGGSGHDIIDGEQDDDLLRGGAGNDFIGGSYGSDYVYGDAGDDNISGDTLDIEWAAGNDHLYGGDGNDTIEGGAYQDWLYGEAGNDVLRGDSLALDALDHGNDLLDGGAGLDQLFGHGGNDTLNGGTDADTMAGGAGNDFFYVDSTGDVVIEAIGEGSDRIFASANYVLGAGVHVEILSTTNNAGTGAINLTGNELVNSLAGNAGANVLNGGAGADTLNGLGGNDMFFVDNVGDVVVEYAGGGSDRVLASVSYALGAGVEVEILSTTNNAGTDAINLTGNALANIIAGNAGANVLNGGSGADTLNGLAGNDWFYVDNAGDTVIEYVGGGTADRVLASVSYTLGAGVEVEILSTANNAGTGAVNLTGNALANSIVGNAGNNVLNGGAGADTLNGFGGDDWYFVDQFGDAVIEAAGGGSDRIFASSSYAMGAGVHAEILSTTNNAGVAAINLAGNELANSIAGNAGANVLNGLGGSDTLNGLGGADTYRFSTALGVGNVDTVVGYVVADDTIQLDDAVFTGLAAGALAAGAFNTGAGATQADDRIIYNAATGALLFDADGSGAGAAIQFATLSPGLAMSASEFFVI